MSAEAALKFAAEHGVEFVDVRFTDLLGQWHHLTIPIEEFGLDAFENGSRVRRVEPARLGGDQRIGHAADPGHVPILGRSVS